MHDLPVVPKEPLIPNSTFNATVERVVLLEIFKKTDGPHWHNKSGWMSSSSHCHWYGVRCSNLTRGRVTVLSLVSNNLQGTLPPTLWMLRDLQGLCLGANPGIRGRLEDFLSSNMTRLMRLDMASDSLEGGIPDFISGLKSLVKIQLSGNKLSGVIPPSIGQLSELQVLSLGENAEIGGNVPDAIGKLSKLWFLDLESLATLNTTITPFLNLSSLRFLHLSESGLHGTLPDDFGFIFSGLLECLMSRNKLQGSIPSTFGRMTVLVHLNLAENNFNGRIPKGFGDLNNLEVLDLSFNSLTGFEDAFIFNSTKLTLVTISQNKGFAVQLSHLLQKLQPSALSLRNLEVSGCQLTGSIPSTLWSFSNLIELDVKKNSLSGHLPLPIDNMLFLFRLDFSANNLTGNIPEAYAKLLGLQTFDVSHNPRLKGADKDSSKIPRFAKTDNTTMVREREDDRFTCPVIRFKYNDGVIKMDSLYYDRIYCACDENYYGTKGQCLHCMSGGLCTRRVGSFMQITSGYWPSPSPDNTTHLVSCRNAGPTSTVCSPSGRCKCWVNATSDGRPFTTCDLECICSKGSGGRFCSKCKRNFYSHGGNCNECPSKASDKLEILLPVILLFLLVLAFVIWLIYFRENRKWSVVVIIMQIIVVTILHIFDFVPSWLLEINIIVLLLALVGHGSQARGILKIALFYFQLLDAMISNFNRWPARVLQIQRYFSNVFNFKFEGLECYFSDLFTPVGKLTSLLLLPVGVTLGTSLVYFAIVIFYKIFNNEGEIIKKARNYSVNFVIVFLNLIYFPIVKRSFSALSPCLKDKECLYVAQNPWIDCPSDEYRIMRILGFCSLALYILGIPFALFLPLLLWTFVYRPGNDEQNDRDSWLGSLYLAYEGKYRNFLEICFLLRRALFAAALSFIPHHSSFQVPVLAVGFLISLLLHMAYKPYRCPSHLNICRIAINVENNLESLNLTTLLLSFIALGQESVRSNQNVTLLWIIIAGNCFTTVACIIGAVMRLVTREMRGNFENAEAPPA